MDQVWLRGKRQMYEVSPEEARADDSVRLLQFSNEGVDDLQAFLDHQPVLDVFCIDYFYLGSQSAGDHQAIPE